MSVPVFFPGGGGEGHNPNLQYLKEHAKQFIVHAFLQIFTI